MLLLVPPLAVGNTVAPTLDARFTVFKYKEVVLLHLFKSSCDSLRLMLTDPDCSATLITFPDPNIDLKVTEATDSSSIIDTPLPRVL